jgi:DDE superfamily endonuclease
MLPDATLPVPASLMSLLAGLGPLFTAPSFRTFCGLACGFWTQTGRRTVCGMLAGAGLSRVWPHDRAHWFFSRARWDPGDLGLAVARLVVSLLVPAGQPVLAAIDDTLFRRRGKKVWAASWFHDGSVPGRHKTGYGNTWVVLAIIVRLPFCSRSVALPVLAKLVVKGTSSASRLWLARRMTAMLAGALAGRDIHVVADSAYAGEELKKLGKGITWTTRLRKDAALYQLPPERTGRRGRPRVRGARLPSLAGLAGTADFTPVTVTRYGKTATVYAATITCLWYSVFGTRHARVVLIRDTSATGYDLALVTTDLNAGTAAIIERYASRWSIEGRDRRRQAGLRHRPGPQPGSPGGPPHHPLPARLPEPGDDLVRNRRPRPRRHRRPPRPLVPQQDPPVHRRHARQAPPRRHRRQI